MNALAPPEWLETASLVALQGSVVAVGLALGLAGTRWLAGAATTMAQMVGRQWLFGRRMRRARRWQPPWPELRVLRLKGE